MKLDGIVQAEDFVTTPLGHAHASMAIMEQNANSKPFWVKTVPFLSFLQITVISLLGFRAVVFLCV